MSFWGSGILNGLRITMRNMLRGPITIQYPHQKAEIPERARWAVAIKPDEEGNHKCTACMACEKVCPDYIIKIDVTTGEDRSKHIDRWIYEVGACMMCGLCVEACPFDAIKMDHDYELATSNPDDLTVALLEDTDAAKPKRKAAAAKPAAAKKPEAAEGQTPPAGESGDRSKATAPAAVKPAAEVPERDVATEPAAEVPERDVATEPAAEVPDTTKAISDAENAAAGDKEADDA